MAVVRTELIPRVRIFNTATPGASSDILPTNLTITRPAAMLSVYCCFSASGILSVRRTIGGVTTTELLNKNEALIAGAAYDFMIVYHADTELNFRYSAGSGTTYILSVDETT